MCYNELNIDVFGYSKYLKDEGGHVSREGMKATKFFHPRPKLERVFCYEFLFSNSTHIKVNIYSKNSLAHIVARIFIHQLVAFSHNEIYF